AFIAVNGANLVWLNNGHGSFSSNGQALGSRISQGVALGDVDGDGDIDAVVANNGANEIWLNNGSGQFTSSGQTLGSRNSQDVALADLDGDGDLDAYFAGYGADEVYVNDGSGVFTLNQSVGLNQGIGVGLANLDNDGQPEITEDDVVTFSSGTLTDNDFDIDTTDILTIVAVDDLGDGASVTLVDGNVV
ncbi:MAG: VCBS repeat-containing protein, partial [Planctomycetes bacterium]|nr:VCBS repeat-containing protein [Planctomycetota bacterium]